MTTTSALRRSASGGRGTTGPASASQNPWADRCIVRKLPSGPMTISAIVLDLDGVIVDTEEVWDRERRAYVAAHGGTWTDTATRAMQGMSSAEWSRYLRDELGTGGEPAEISRAVAGGGPGEIPRGGAARVVEEVRRNLPLLPGAVGAVEALGAQRTLALAS